TQELEAKQLQDDMAIVNDPMYNEQWGLKNDGTFSEIAREGIDINVSAVWDKQTTGNDDNIVAVIDTGVDYNHEDLKDNMWVNPYKSYELPGKYGYDFTNNDDDPMDDNMHGTHCAGIIGAKGNNGIGITGINQDVKIMAVKVMDKSGSLAESIDFYKGMEYVLRAKILGENVVAVNVSIGGASHFKISKYILEQLSKNDIIPVCAAGNGDALGISKDNDKFTNSPSDIKTDLSITVGAMDYEGKKTSFSNYGKVNVDVFAPGYEILSTIPDNGYEKQSGTSMATPMVTGSIALLKSYSDNNNLNWDMAQIRARILGATANDGIDLENLSVSGGYIDLEKAISNPDPVLNKAEYKDGLLTVSGYFFGAQNEILFDGEKLEVVSWSDREIIAKAPQKVEYGYRYIQVKNSLGYISGKHFELYEPLLVRIVNPPSKTQYFPFDNIDRTGMKVVVHYADGRSSETEDYQISVFMTDSESYISVVYEGLLAEENVPITTILPYGKAGKDVKWNVVTYGESLWMNFNGTGAIEYSEDYDYIMMDDYIVRMSISNFEIEDGISEIGSEVFANVSKNIDKFSIIIPESVTKIAEDAFAIDKNMIVIKGYEGSYAQEYAVKQGIEFEVLQPDYSEGWNQTEDSKWVYSQDDQLVTGWRNDLKGWEGYWFYFDNDGIMQSGWQNNIPGWENCWFYFDKNGVMQNGWQFISWSGGTDWFYFDANGIMLKDAITPDGYYVDANGVWRG
ncbi:MAG: S8 family serine peptidase, partial [Clostridia bacterium]|nr:S8 family serine peptidase [Clostridia bacterium]